MPQVIQRYLFIGEYLFSGLPEMVGHPALRHIPVTFDQPVVRVIAHTYEGMNSLAGGTITGKFGDSGLAGKGMAF